ncbi:uncharacterized protein LOC143287195 [Babylonia areolata]|uniref:uncharacterized protein LOC143287195 n=1 Tax=Babylonia areolata TaxID=304850 RepID=UPI003FD69AC9
MGQVGAQANCQKSFLTLFLQCVSNSTLSPQHFLWVTRDGNMGVQPPDEAAFTLQACLVEDHLTRCFKGVSDQFKGFVAGCSDADKNTIQTFHRGVVKSLDSKCSDPCREQLLPSLAECFTSSEVNATLFLSNMTMSRHSMLGHDNDDVDKFCTKREEILDCIKTKAAMCSETPDILLAAGIDVDAMNSTVVLLCDNRQLYLHGVRCSQNRSVEEEQCQDRLLQELSDLESQFQALNIDKDTYAIDVCRVRLDHIQCDLNYLSRRDEDSKCPDEVVGLRREQECTLLPEDCKEDFKDRVMDMCDPMRFLLKKRKEFVRASKQTKSSAAPNASFYNVYFVVLVVFIRSFVVSTFC